MELGFKVCEYTNTLHLEKAENEGLYCPAPLPTRKSRKSRDPWSDRQVQPWSTHEAGQRLTEFPKRPHHS